MGVFSFFLFLKRFITLTTKNLLKKTNTSELTVSFFLSSRHAGGIGRSVRYACAGSMTNGRSRFQVAQSHTTEFCDLCCLIY